MAAGVGWWNSPWFGTFTCPIPMDGPCMRHSVGCSFCPPILRAFGFGPKDSDGVGRIRKPFPIFIGIPPNRGCICTRVREDGIWRMIMPRLVGSCLTPKISFEGEFSISIFSDLGPDAFHLALGCKRSTCGRRRYPGSRDCGRPARTCPLPRSGEESSPGQSQGRFPFVPVGHYRKPVREAEWSSCFPTALF